MLKLSQDDWRRIILHHFPDAEFVSATYDQMGHAGFTKAIVDAFQLGRYSQQANAIFATQEGPGLESEVVVDGVWISSSDWQYRTHSQSDEGLKFYSSDDPQRDIAPALDTEELIQLIEQG